MSVHSERSYFSYECTNRHSSFMRTSMTEVYARDENYTAYLMQRVPAGRWGMPEDLVGAVIYLAGPASAFVNGATLIVDGGFCAK